MRRRHPKGPRFYQWAEGSPLRRSLLAGDPSLRLKNGYARDDASRRRLDSKWSRYPNQLTVRVSTLLFPPLAQPTFPEFPLGVWTITLTCPGPGITSVETFTFNC